MEGIIGSSPYLVEILTPKQSEEDFEASLPVFRERYNRIVHEGHIVSVPDNPLGNLHFTALEVIQYDELEIKPRQFLLHLNTFHRKVDLDGMLEQADEMGVQSILCISGDGGPRLPKLEPEDLNMQAKSVTSVELLRYIESAYPGRFNLGVAFNQYEPLDHELKKLDSKLEAGARFVATQPVLGENASIRELLRRDLPVYLGAWMSRNVRLLEDCVGYPVDDLVADYDPAENLRRLQEDYRVAGYYLSLLSFKGSWESILPQAGLVGGR
ncbi:MAG: methylenetetrahydrofolate reductase [Spirochaetales bacterium]|nr:methylenetetrahydrofolate reductase [Spirochaetales bacterium]